MPTWRAAGLYVGRSIVEMSRKHGTIANGHQASGLCAGRHDGCVISSIFDIDA
jgi:hypothetical protein